MHISSRSYTDAIFKIWQFGAEILQGVSESKRFTENPDKFGSNFQNKFG